MISSGSTVLSTAGYTLSNWNKAPVPPSTAQISKFWGVWLPVPTVLAIATSIFFTWLILSTVGFVEAPIEKAAEQIIERF